MCSLQRPGLQCARVAIRPRPLSFSLLLHTQKEIEDIIRVGYLNGLFVLARSIGLIGALCVDEDDKQAPLRQPVLTRGCLNCACEQFMLSHSTCCRLGHLHMHIVCRHQPAHIAHCCQHTGFRRSCNA